MIPNLRAVGLPKDGKSVERVDKRSIIPLHHDRKRQQNRPPNRLRIQPHTLQERHLMLRLRRFPRTGRQRREAGDRRVEPCEEIVG